MDRASGSGVFARDPDALLDMTELEMDEMTKLNYADDGATAWRMEGSLREFRDFTPVDFWFRYPIHTLDRQGNLDDLPLVGTSLAGKLKNGKAKTSRQCEEEFRLAYQAENMDDNGVSVNDMATHLGLAERTIRERVKKMDGAFILRNGIILEA